MKTQTKLREVSTVGKIGQTTNFQIKATAHSFKILSDGLYSDKIRAVIRELSCNAYDSHIEAGKADKPFEVHLPTIIEPYFSVKDFGVGLSHENVLHLYTTYFETTKDHSDDFIGQLGLGSKSPFSYTDTFNVTSHFNGVKRIYIAVIGESGVPQISLLNETQTEDGNGLEVKLAVKSHSDYGSFQQKAQEILCIFDPIPNVTGLRAQIKPIKIKLSGKNWMFREAEQYSRYGHENNPWAIQGNVVYPIDMNAIQGLKDHPKYEQLRSLLRRPIGIWFKIGNLEVAANRESLSYDKRTSQNLIDHLVQILDNLQKDLELNLDKNCKTVWEAQQYFNDNLRAQFYYRGGHQSIHTTDIINVLNFKGQVIKGNIDGKSKIRKISIVKFEMSKMRSSYGAKTGKLFDRDWDVVAPIINPSHPDRHEHVLSLLPDKNTIFVYDDLGRGAHTRIKNFMNDQPISDDDNDKLIKKVYLFRFDEKHIKELSEIFGQVEFKLVSNFLKIKKIQSQKTKRSLLFKLNLYHQSSLNDRNTWVALGKDDVIPQDGKYVPLERRQAGINITLSSLKNLLLKAGLTDLANTEYYGVPKYRVGRLKGVWTNYIDEIKSELLKLITDDVLKLNKLHHHLPVGGNLDIIHSDDCMPDNELISKFSQLDPSICHQFLTAWNEYKLLIEQNSEIESIRTLLYQFDVPFPEYKGDIYNFKANWTTITKLYPMLALLTRVVRSCRVPQNHVFVEERDALIIYMKTVDKYNKLVSNNT